MQAICDDFRAECADLDSLLAGLDPARWGALTQFSQWTVQDIVEHLLFWDRAALLAVDDPPALAALMTSVRSGLSGGRMLREIEQEVSSVDAVEVHSVWRSTSASLAHRYTDLDPSHRVQWAGPDMSVRSALSARLMETWAHAQAIHDLVGLEREHADRVRHVVVLGFNTFKWSFAVRGMEPPGPRPQLQLTSPSGAKWTFGEETEGECIEGSAVEFAQVVTQTRNVMDTALVATGECARAWMRSAQCFAGPAETPPAPGTRYRVRV